MYANGVSEVFISFGNYISSILSHCCTLNLMAGPIPITLLLPELCSEIVHGQPLNVYKKIRIKLTIFVQLTELMKKKSKQIPFFHFQSKNSWEETTS